MEAQQGDATAVRYLFKRGMDVGPRSRSGMHPDSHMQCVSPEGCIVSSCSYSTPTVLAGHILAPYCWCCCLVRFADVLLWMARYLHLAWAMWEKQNGNINNARKLLDRGQRLNPRDAPILQVSCVCAVHILPGRTCPH
jgi:hypothetical protein